MDNDESASANYADAVTGLDEFGATLKTMLGAMLQHRDVKFHTIDYRVKTEESATQKIENDPDKYASFEDLHDLLGVRITCYINDDVKEAAKVFDKEFETDPKKSRDMGSELPTKQFGYRSVHRVGWLNEDRAKLAEYNQFEQPKRLRFEVQIRTVLQHAWAEIEHDLGYKWDSPPEKFSRRFSMLAGVLELVDLEFQALDGEIAEYEKDAEQAAKGSGSDMALDVATLDSIIQFDRSVMDLDDTVAAAAGIRLRDEELHVDTLDHRLLQLRVVGLRSISDVRNAVAEWGAHILAFVPLWMHRSQQRAAQLQQPRLDSFPRGVGLHYLWLVMAFEAHRLGRDGGLTPIYLDSDGPDVWGKVLEEAGEAPTIPT